MKASNAKLTGWPQAAGPATGGSDVECFVGLAEATSVPPQVCD